MGSSPSKSKPAPPPIPPKQGFIPPYYPAPPNHPTYNPVAPPGTYDPSGRPPPAQQPPSGPPDASAWGDSWGEEPTAPPVAPGHVQPSAPPVAPGYVQPPAPTPPVQPTPSGHRVVVSLDAQRIGWLATPSGHNREDYVYHRDVSHTGDLLDTSGRAVGKICDVKPHKLSPGGGLLLSGPLTFGKYVSDDGVESTFGHLSLPPVEVSDVAVSVALCVKLHRPLQTESCLFYMGSGWNNHFSIRHYRGRLLFEACPQTGGCGWGDRREVSEEFECDTGRQLSIVAVLGNNGSMTLYVDGKVIAAGRGLGEIPHFSADDIGKRKECFVGRWMRPDQSFPTWAELYTLEIFDGALDPAAVARHAKSTPGPSPPVYVDPPVYHANGFPTGAP